MRRCAAFPTYTMSPVRTGASAAKPDTPASEHPNVEDAVPHPHAGRGICSLGKRSATRRSYPPAQRAANQTAALSFSGAFAPIVHDRRDALLRSFPNLRPLRRLGVDELRLAFLPGANRIPQLLHFLRHEDK
jgi:hypothetical protein